jgi:hypothetical protein
LHIFVFIPGSAVFWRFIAFRIAEFYILYMLSTAHRVALHTLVPAPPAGGGLLCRKVYLSYQGVKRCEPQGFYGIFRFYLEVASIPTRVGDREGVSDQ